MVRVECIYIKKQVAQLSLQVMQRLMLRSTLFTKKAKLFYQELEISDLEGLTAACEDGRVAALAGCGEKTAAKILEAIQLKKRNASLFLYRKARSAADKIIAALRELPQLQRIEMAGSLRRFKNVTKDADILASTEEPAAVMAVFVTLPEVDTVLTHGVTKSSVIMKGGIQSMWSSREATV